MKLTLLTIVQRMLSACDAETVSTVGDTPEADMCVQIANRAFEQMITFKRWKHMRNLVALQASSALNRLELPAGAHALDTENVWYADTPVTFLPLEDFIKLTIGRDETQSNVEVLSNLKIYDDRNPQYYTTDDDIHLIFDAYPDDVSGLDASDSLAIIHRGPTSLLTSDNEYFELPAIAFPALETLCIAIALSELKGDSTLGRMYEKKYIKMMGSLAVNSRLIEPPDDRRKWIVARRPSYTSTPRIAN